MGVVKEFKEFAMKGNVVDMAVGIIIGGAFGKIISSFVADILMPPIGLLVGGTDFTDLKVVLKDAQLDAAGAEVAEVAIAYGKFIQVTVDFIIIAFAIFMMIKAMNRLTRKEEAAAAPPPPPGPTKDQELLMEIRDQLIQNSNRP